MNFSFRDYFFWKYDLTKTEEKKKNKHENHQNKTKINLSKQKTPTNKTSNLSGLLLFELFHIK